MYRRGCSKGLSLLLLLILELVLLVKGQQTSDTDTNRPVNVFVINDVNNDVANKSVTNSLKALKEKSPDKLGQVYVAQINVSDSEQSLNTICSLWQSTLGENEANAPDFVLDTTTYGIGAETVNRFTALLGIPTLSAQFGQEGDLLGWREISEEQKKYLVQVMNPADLMPEVIRQQCSNFSISNAAILFDENFIMDHKYKSLLLNVPTRHVIVPAEPPGAPLQRQISKLRDLDIVNFFILGSEDTISAALQQANNLNFTGPKYGWFGITLNEEFQAQCQNCRNISLLLFKPKSESNQQLSELTSKGSLLKPVISSAFYYDLTKLGVLAMKSALTSGEWRRPHFISCDDYNENVTLPARNLDLRQRLKQAENSSEFTRTYASFAWGKNGESRAKFDVNGVLIQIRDSKVISSDPIETWEAGVDTPLRTL